jgi:hypothetical protein
VPEHASSASRLPRSPPEGREDSLVSILRRVSIFFTFDCRGGARCCHRQDIPHAPPHTVGPRRHPRLRLLLTEPHAGTGQRGLGSGSRVPLPLSVHHNILHHPGIAKAVLPSKTEGVTAMGLSVRCRPRATYAPDRTCIWVSSKHQYATRFKR